MRLILQRANHLEAGAIADVRQPRIAMPAEIPLQNPAIRRAVEHRAPFLELAHPSGRFLGVDLGHPPVVQELAAAHRVGEMHLPVVAILDIRRAPPRRRLRPSRCAPCRAATCRRRRPARRLAAASIAARSPAPPAPMTRTSCSNVSTSAIRRSSSRARCPSSTGGCRGRRTRPSRARGGPTACDCD